jgi:tetratricopeptide (TPR) repeat protein
MAAAVSVIAMMAGCHPKKASDDMAAGDQAVQAGKLPEAEADYQAAVSAAPGDPRPHVALGKVYLKEQKTDPAELEFMKALDLNPRSASAHAALGEVYVAQTRLGLAEAQYRAAVALAPAATDYRLDLGSTLQKADKLSAAEAEFLTAVGLEPKNAHAHLALAGLLSTVTMPAAPAPAASPAMPALRAVERKFLLTHDSPVYQTPSASSPPVAQVHRRRYVHVTGIQGSWLRIKMRNGTVGFIPISAAE